MSKGKIITSEPEKFECERLLAEFVTVLRSHAESGTALAGIVRQYIDECGEDAAEGREDLITAGVEAGYSESYVRNVVSAALIDSGHRARKPGSGPKAPAEAVRLADKLVAKHGPEAAAKLLLAAYRKAKASVGKTVAVAA